MTRKLYKNEVDAVGVRRRLPIKWEGSNKIGT